MSININANVNVSPQSIKKLQADLKKAVSAIGTSGAGGATFSPKVNDRDFTRPLGRITGQVSEFRKSLDASNARVIAFAASAGVLYKVSQAFDFLLKSTINVEKQLKDINVVLGASDKNLKAFGNQLFSIAANTGQSFQVVAAAATEFSRQGLSMERTLKRTSDALILARLSGMDTVEATNALTAAVNSFSSAAINTSQVVAKLAAVDAAFAVSSADLAEGMKRSGAAAEAAGVSMDELFAIITAVQERTARGGAVIGNSLKTIFTRIQRPEVLNQLNRLGVSIVDTTGKIKPAMDILTSFAKRFDSLTQAQQATSAELVGGVFQVNNLKAALGDLSSEYSRYAQAVKIASTASDEATKRNQDLNTTLSAQLNVLAQNAQKFGSAFGELTIKPVLERGISVGNMISDVAGIGGVGKVVGESILKGIGDIISGPGLVVIFGGIFKLLKQFGKFALEAANEFRLMGTHTGRVRDMQSQITNILNTNADIAKRYNTGLITRLELEKQITNQLNHQNRISASHTATGQMLGANVLHATTNPPKGFSRRSHGHVPDDVAFAERQGAFAGGYTPGQVRSMNIPGVGKVAYNTREQVKTFPGFSQPAIIPPAGSKAGVRYRRAFESVNGFTPMNSGGFSFQQSGMQAGPSYDANLQSFLNIGAAESGLKVGQQTSSGIRIANATTAVRQKVLTLYQQLIKRMETQGLDLDKESRVRQHIARRYKISDQSLDKLTDIYKQEADAALQRGEGARKNTAARLRADITQANLNQQRFQNMQASANRGAEANFLATQAKESKSQRRMMAGALLAPMLMQGIAGTANAMMGDPKTGAEYQKQSAISSGMSLGGNLLSMGMFTAGMHPLGRGAMMLLSAIGPMAEFMGSFDKSTAATFDAQKAQENVTAQQQKAQEVIRAMNEYQTEMSDSNSSYQGKLKKAGALKTALSNAGLLENKNVANALDSFLSNAGVDPKAQGVIMNAAAGNIENANTAFTQANLAKLFAGGKEDNYSGFIDQLFASTKAGGSTVFDAIVSQSVAKGEPISSADILSKNSTNILGSDLANVVKGLGDAEEMKPLAEALDKRLKQDLEFFDKVVDTKDSVKKGIDKVAIFKDRLTTFLDDYTTLFNEADRKLKNYAVITKASQAILNMQNQAFIERAGMQYGDLTMARLKRDAANAGLDARAQGLATLAGPSVLAANKSAIDPLFQGLQTNVNQNNNIAPFMNAAPTFGPMLQFMLQGSMGASNQISKGLQDAGMIDEAGTFANALQKSTDTIQKINNKNASDMTQIYAEKLAVEKQYVEDLKKIRLENEINFGGGINAFKSSASPSQRGLRYRMNQGLMGGRNSRQSGLMALENLELLKSYAGSGFTSEMMNDNGGNQLRRGLMDYHRQTLAGMGLQASERDLKRVADAQMRNTLRPEDERVGLEATLSINDLIKSIHEDGIIIRNVDSLAQAVTRSARTGRRTGSANVAADNFEMSSGTGLTSEEIKGKYASPNIHLEKTQGSGYLKGVSDAFFIGNDTRTQTDRTLDAIRETGEALRGGLASGLKEAIMAADDFGDALRNMAVNVLDQIADKLFSFAIDAAFAGTGQYLSSRSYNNNNQAQGNTARGAKGGYVTSGGIQRFASGGLVQGGSGFRDDVPAMLSQGEFVIRKSAVQKYGSGFLNTLNMNTGGAVISAPNTLIANDPKRATEFKYNISNRLSAFAVTNQDDVTVQRRTDLANRIMNNRAQYLQAMDAYKKEQKARLIQAYISAGIQLAAAGAAQYGGSAGGAPSGEGMTMNNATGPGANYGPGTPQYVNSGGYIRRYASGGYVDDVPALLMGGEMVMNRDSVNKYGRGFFDKLNRGQLKMSEGGLVGGEMSFGGGSSTSVMEVFDRLIESNEALKSSIDGVKSNEGGASSLQPSGGSSSASNNVTININVDKSGKVDSTSESSSTGAGDQKAEEEKARNMSESIRAACLDVIINEKRPGGALADLKGPRA